MKNLYFIINYLITLLTTFIFGTQVSEFYLKPVKEKKDERPHNPRM